MSKIRLGSVILELMHEEFDDDLTVCIPETPPVPNPNPSSITDMNLVPAGQGMVNEYEPARDAASHALADRLNVNGASPNGAIRTTNGGPRDSAVVPDQVTVTIPHCVGSEKLARHARDSVPSASKILKCLSIVKSGA